MSEDPATVARAAKLSLSGVLLIAACHFSAYVDRAIPGVFAPALKVEFGLSDTQIGVLQGPAFVAIYALGLLATGHSRNRVPLGPLAVACVVAWTFACLAFALADNFTTLMVSRGALGLAQAAFTPTAILILAAITPIDRLARATSMFTAASASGRSGAMIMGGLLLAGVSGLTGLVLDDWRTATIMMTLPNILLAVWLWRGARTVAPAVRQRSGLTAAARVIAASPTLALHIAAGTAVILVIQSGAAWTPSVLNRSLDMSPASSALVAGLVVLTAAPTGHLLAGWRLDRDFAVGRGPATVMLIGVVTAAIGAVLMGLTSSLPGGLGGLFLMTAGGGAGALGGLAGLASLSAPSTHGSVVSIYLTVCAVIGSGLGPVLTGLASDILFPHEDGLADALMMTAGSAALAAVALIAASEWNRRMHAPQTA